MKPGRQSRAIVLGILALLLAMAMPVFAAEENEHEHEEGEHHDDGHSVEFGEPADASQADRTVTITAEDTMRFSPPNVKAKADETIRFVVNNTGKIAHSFTLGTPMGQQMHEAEMQGMPMSEMGEHMQGDPTGMVIQPGQTGSITWHFTGNQVVEFACHMPGHYMAGMKGSIEIQ